MAKEIPQVPNKYINDYVYMPKDQKKQRVVKAIEHMERYNEPLFRSLNQVPHQLDIEDPQLFQRAACDVYMALRDHLSPMPAVSVEDYLALERKLMSPDSNNVLNDITSTMERENPHLHQLVFMWLSEVDDIRHANGAMIIYKLLRDGYLSATPV